ncbi:MAG TPA: OmpW family outer membrane protein [Ferrovibrio sp.]|uniref:OmpA family protein n=1 Tax=Ferrovibrio sp. TaxID=1917215 RepID=UPI002B4B6D67|nr:OmpW family outer membrane protein [Ferrovibrio sp.]HLT76630.1 OmpW family outer membrane protein [Ferrovibrio sp.]
MNVRIALLAGAALVGLASAPAVAQGQGPYVGIAGGASWIEDADISGAAPVTTLEFDTGWAALLKGGYALGNGLRPELELGIRDWDVDGANGGIAASGELKMYTVFANLNYDFLPNGNWSPYLGAGLGVARFSGDVTAGGVTGSGQDTTWAAQGIAGLWYALNNNWLVSADYRYQFGGDPDFGGGVEGDHSIHTVMLGLTYRFGAPAPAPQPAVAAPAPAPAPAPAAAAPPPPPPRLPETYVVFFAFDRAEVSPVAAQVLDRAIADFRSTGMTNIVIEGHADRSGSDAYNQRLSQRRAESVAAYLRSKGIGQNAIQTAAFGESRPRVPTADGVRNDENRRAELFLRK